MGRKAFWTTYHGQKWTTAVFSAGPAIVWADSLSPVSSTLYQQASISNNQREKREKSYIWERMATFLVHLVSLLRVKKKTENTCIQIHMNSRFSSSPKRKR